ncbi:response regulator transcription factor [Fredinandcohnia humi]
MTDYWDKNIEIEIFLTKDEPKKNDLTHPYDLTKREIELLRLLAKGIRNQEIAEKLFLSEGTIKNYISNIYSKLEVHSRKEAAKKALNERII